MYSPSPSDPDVSESSFAAANIPSRRDSFTAPMVGHLLLYRIRDDQDFSMVTAAALGCVPYHVMLCSSPHQLCAGGQRVKDKALAEDVLRSKDVQRVYAVVLGRDEAAMTSAASVLMNLSMTRFAT